MTAVREPAVAGQFYPNDARQLKHIVSGFLDAVDVRCSAPKAIIVPHAGYIYSGSVAASAYARLGAAREIIKRVILLGPSHRVPFSGLALSSANSFATPLGEVSIDQEAEKLVRELPFVHVLDAAHAWEHSLEVQLPFLQRTLREFTLVPIVVGDATPEQVSEALQCLWGGAETMIVVSSDLSHYHDFNTAKRRDAATTRAIEALDVEHIGPDDACGCNPIKGLLLAAKQRGLKAFSIDVRNSGETAGPRDQVVGYGSYIFQS